ncbi:MAG: enoyl-CoA hydratase [Proteobacteria bacterium]|nr:enoyl-CoA hydratase [Pseudomonadota bacterium]
MAENKTSSGQFLLRNDEKGVCYLTINRPDAYNALSIECMKALIHELETLSTDSKATVVVISGSGKGFCAGHDLQEINRNPNRSFYEKTFTTCSKMMMAVCDLPKPVIAKVHGVATAAGCQLVSSCDLAIADEKARFATPGVNIGLFCSTPMVALSRTVSKKHAMEMLLLGDMISAQRAYEIGLINRIAPFERLDQETEELASKIASKSPLTLKVGKKTYYDQISMDLAGAYDLCSRVMVDNLMTHDAKEGIDAFLGKRPPVWRGE